MRGQWACKLLRLQDSLNPGWGGGGGGGEGGKDGVKRDRELISDGKCAPQTGSRGQGWILCLHENIYAKIPKENGLIMRNKDKY
jgi:hypothetical protein